MLRGPVEEVNTPDEDSGPEEGGEVITIISDPDNMESSIILECDEYID